MALEEYRSGKRRKRDGSPSDAKPAGGNEPKRTVSTQLAGVPALTGARRAPAPEAIEPQLATLVEQPPAGDTWIHEIKLDGYRMLAHVRNGKAVLYTRRGLDWSERFGRLSKDLSGLAVEEVILDGEVVVLDSGGKSDFQALQNALQGTSAALTYYTFDLLYWNGWDLRGVRLDERKEVLRAVVAESRGIASLRLNDHMVGNGEATLAQACKMGLEGIVSKRRNAIYRSGRGESWLKCKCVARQEFVVGGYTEPAGSREFFGALLLGLYVGDELRYAGKSGTGFSQASLRELHRKLAPLRQAQPAFVDPPRGMDARGTHWVRPELVAEVAFAGFTAEGRARHATFRGLREDKRAREVHREV
jgi:bifunctional non-homologous end joining protein LigD